MDDTEKVYTEHWSKTSLSLIDWRIFESPRPISIFAFPSGGDQKNYMYENIVQQNKTRSMLFDYGSYGGGDASVHNTDGDMVGPDDVRVHGIKIRSA